MHLITFITTITTTKQYIVINGAIIDIVWILLIHLLRLLFQFVVTPMELIHSLF